MSIFTTIATSKIANELLLPQALTAALELLINKALLLNINKGLSLHAVSEKTLTLELAELVFPLSFTVSSQATQAKVMVSSLTERSDCTISTSVSTLKKLKADQQVTQLIKQGELDVVGDVKIAQHFAAIAQSLEIDWQSELAKHIGDVPTHKILQLGNKITKTLGKHSTQLQADVGEYIVHEKRLVATHGQVKHFSQQVADVSKNVDKINSRINTLFSQLSNKK
jgi:ubiquinone biosynthesis protein UbiJ